MISRLFCNILESRQFDTKVKGIECLKYTVILYWSITSFSTETRYAFFGKLEYGLCSCTESGGPPIRLLKWWCSKISVSVIKVHRFPSMTSQRCSESRSVVATMTWQMAWGIHQSLFQDHMCLEEGVPFPYYYKCSKKLAEFWGPQRENWVRVQAERRVWQEESKWSPPGMEKLQTKNSQENQQLLQSWIIQLGKEAILVGTIIWHILKWKLKLWVRESYYTGDWTVKWMLYRNIEISIQIVNIAWDIL